MQTDRHMLVSGMRCLLVVAAAVVLFAQDVRVDGWLWAMPMYIGGSQEDTPYAATVDVSGNAYVIGWSNSPERPTGAFLMKVAPSGAILYSLSLFNPFLAAGLA